MSAPRSVVGLAAALVLAITGSGCGASSVASNVASDPVAQAADVTSHMGGAHMTLSAQVSAPGLPSAITMSGEGFFNYRTQEGTISLQIAGLPAAATASLGSQTLQMEEIFKSSSIYIGSPLFAGKLPGGARWMKLELARVGQALGFNLQQLTGGQTNPAQLLEYLKAGGGNVTAVGHELVRGVPTTHYTGKVDLAKVAGVVPPAERAALRAGLEQLRKQYGVSELPIEVWVDSHRLVRRVAIALSVPVAGQTLALHLSVELFDFGSTPLVSAPAAGEVYNATPSALAGLASGG